jgi:murein DD-endopeptidase MepM/ murein hydrolase activator NlpD
VRNHNGVDWAAPTGTPVRAVADGVLALIGDGGGYGNVIYIDHPGGMQTRYAHLHTFADGLQQGAQIAAGQTIGHVGTTGRSTGPHLHFELHVAGSPVDPLTFTGIAGQGGAVASGAVDALVNQIIQVESAGDARAKNPLSTATGLGQFIESTWLRMMRDYRPDLAGRMTRAQLLELRFDPALSREMVTHLARENESFLRARGHDITSGRLYLAHFLGPAGAHTALSANPQATVLDVMGAAVVNANPFLRGKSVSDLLNWADRKMVGRSGAVGSAPRRITIPPEVAAYRQTVDAILAAL